MDFWLLLLVVCHIEKENAINVICHAKVENLLNMVFSKINSNYSGYLLGKFFKNIFFISAPILSSLLSSDADVVFLCDRCRCHRWWQLFINLSRHNHLSVAWWTKEHQKHLGHSGSQPFLSSRYTYLVKRSLQHSQVSKKTEIIKILFFYTS